VTGAAGSDDEFWALHQPQPVKATFVPREGGEIRLLAFQVQPQATPTEARLTLYWQAAAPLTREYTVFVHSLAADGRLLGQADGPPVANHYPTTAWQAGEIVQDSRLVPSGERYCIGLYLPARGERLPAFAADGTRLSDDAVLLIPRQP